MDNVNIIADTFIDRKIFYGNEWKVIFNKETLIFK